MHDDTTEPFSSPAVGRKKVTAAFDGGHLTSDSGVMLLAAAERHIGIAERLAGLIANFSPPLTSEDPLEPSPRVALAIRMGWERLYRPLAAKHRVGPR